MSVQSSWSSPTISNGLSSTGFEDEQAEETMKYLFLNYDSSAIQNLTKDQINMFCIDYYEMDADGNGQVSS